MRELTKEQIEHVAGAGVSSYGTIWDPSHNKHNVKHSNKHHNKHKHNVKHSNKHPPVKVY